jgi:rhodanese-related sulfurtransferase
MRSGMDWRSSPTPTSRARSARPRTSTGPPRQAHRTTGLAARSNGAADLARPPVPTNVHLRPAARPDVGHTEPVSAVDDLVAAARMRLDRVTPQNLNAEIADGAIVVDTRPADQRTADGPLPGALVIDRNVLEWRLDPTCPHRHPAITHRDHRIILVCNEGYSSSLAAATLQDLGLARATDLVGGYQAWRYRRAGDPIDGGATAG